MKKIRIIRTPYVFPMKHLSSITCVPDIGTAYINGTFKKNGYESQIIDAAGEGLDQRHQIDDYDLVIGGITAEEIVSKIPKDVDYIGVQSMHSNRWIYDSFIIKSIIKEFPHVKIFLGGEHVTATAEMILKQIPEISACVIGEGEETVLELLKAFEEGTSLSKVQGIAFNRNGAVRFTEKRKRKANVGDIPLPSWDGVPIAKYLANHCGINSLARKSIPIIATRGCPYSCTFCTVPNMWDSKWYARDQEEVIEEIRGYVEDYGVDHIDFVDLTLVINKKWMHKFCDLLIEADLGITWAIPIGTRTESLDEELLEKMKHSGLSRVLYSAESGSEATLLRIKKCLKLEHFERIVKKTSSLGICVKIAFIFGFPGQTLKEVFDSFLLINKLAYLGASDIVCLSFVPYPKTELFDELGINYNYTEPKENIRLNNDIPNMKSWSEHFGDYTLKFVVVSFTLYFYALQGLIRPKRVFAGFYRVFIKKLPLTNFESIVFNLFNHKKLKYGKTSVKD
ncbi:B12-binding domain-containing radical SAM protein [Halobacteriovorax marinus]|uniref:B12-binding domain-containing radical SAM protein n=1 Tax=Halobacteriovorax marinus TaxID=97084 RepID=UPI003A957A67